MERKGKAKAKPMTAMEKKERARIRKGLREWGALPPKKKPLNRKVFIRKAKLALDENLDYGLQLYLVWALAEMMEKRDYRQTGKSIPYSLEAVGAAKVVLLAIKRREFEKAREGRPFSNRQLYEAIEDIYNA